MAKYGYARVSSNDQDLGVQIEALKNAGCEIIRKEKVSATSLQGREELAILLEFLREGDTLYVTRVDRLCRSARDLANTVHLLQEKGVALVATEQSIDTTSSTGKAFLNMLGVFAELETSLRSERQLAGIARAKKLHPERYKGRTKSIDADEVKRLKAQGLGASAIAKQMNIGRASVYRSLEL
jgi:DNA invertase Pin-like site-specific DNA recombinase